ncbi:NAD(P)-binding oxidoreductase [Curtobacterium sp. PhB146]|uniref:NAD(P)-binding oxidoreductase n=1 Tax=Curtobacterium sp. PhB146 TaxID=2485187 RepID=UPI001045160F|nr:NAD(P)-binding oxidoreductase [Curtobacterium sp. PhB146]TCU45308.1 putative NAD(P)-binding protein [Curtobacterium sp. PhB146]
MQVFQIGAGGNVGRLLARRLSAQRDQVSGMHRAPEQAAAIAETGATPVRGDLVAATVDNLSQLMAGHDAVVFSAGAHGTGRDMTTQIDGEGLVKAAQAAVQAGVRRFILVSAFPESERAAGLGDDFEHYMATKKTADVYLTTTDLDWIIVRPGLLTDEPGSEHVTAGLAVEYGTVSRDNVAAFIAAALHDTSLHHVIVELTDGEVAIDDAVTALPRAA